MKNTLGLTLLLTAGLAAGAASAQMTDATEIVEAANKASYYAGEDGRSAARMTIVQGDGSRQRRQFTLLRQDVADGGDQRYLVVFSRPADIRGTVFRVEKHVGDSDDRWLYLPALDLVKRIAAGDKRTSFVGSHFYYEDISGRGTEEDRHTLIETTEDYYVIESTPKDPDNVAFARYHTRIDRETLLPMRTEYQREDGEVYRRMTVTEVETIDGYPTGTEARMEDLDSGGHTVTQFRFSEYDVGLPSRIFSERSLRNPPRDWLRRE
ncbi:outer membrane lipoprotein-sorting protein [Spiribacter vilamensis]|uniref:Outer membrane lipoprotein-sorting protein n=1 Tax=Spiribacter vilamensis TaxID=531306 RepID=A0A4Q8D0P3_9GAMM|nr:outer membrane lipoprotein-sorting protein [Spiribacter vilamensis]RZU98807.1 outer membrane lipoprotein-sorting protein [Spiribacter vilamensis]TVO62173.1 outer membrane lipoprotein-sorting protein [Spiribacter vilamensis]